MDEMAGRDIAVLEVEREVPARPYRLAGAVELRDLRFWSFGFPQGRDEGMIADGVLGGVTGRG
jgi:hypothetical protein